MYYVDRYKGNNFSLNNFFSNCVFEKFFKQTVIDNILTLRIIKIQYNELY